MNTTTITKSTSGVRKGAWTEEEDHLLRKCVENYGEGKWHLVPVRAGLNRCRKSCRLRWLNYLRPHIKRGDFAPDEIDLTLRLHKLLGNRWSLIAGRLPGRTANDVKNYWNTHLQRKSITTPQRQERKCNINNTKNTILRPRPRTFSSSLANVSWCTNKRMLTNTLDKEIAGNICEKPTGETTASIDEGMLTNTVDKEIVGNICEKPTGETTASIDGGVQWWTSLLENCKEIDEEEAAIRSFEEETKLLPSLFHEETNPPPIQQGQSDGWDNLFADIDLWDLLN